MELKFSDKNLQTYYANSVTKLGSIFFKPIMLSFTIDFGLYAIPSFINNFNLGSTLIIVSILAAFLLLSALFLKKYPKYTRKYTLVLLIIYALIIIEVLNDIKYNREAKFSPMLASMVGINMALNLILYMNFSYKYYSIICLAVFIDLGIRCFDSTDFNSPGVFVSFSINTLSQIYASYNIEKSNKNLYKEIYEKNEFLKTFESLLKDVLPSPILIREVQSGDIVFVNKAVISTFFKGRMDFIEDENTDLTIDKEILTEIKGFIKEFKILNEGESEQNINFEQILENFETELDSMKGSFASQMAQLNFIQKKIEFTQKKQNLLKKKNDNLLNLKNISDEICDKKPILEKKKKSIIETDRTKNDFSGNPASLSLNNSPTESQTKFFDTKIQKILWNKAPCYLILMHDITNMVELSHFRDLDLYKNRLLATVSHDLRTPVNGILGMLETVENNIPEKKDRKLLKMAKKFGNLLICMINDILDFSKISNLQLRLNFESINLLTILKEVEKLFKFQVKEKGLEFKFIHSGISQAYIITDGNRLKQILLNLLSNALKFTFKGGISLVLEKESEHFNYERYKISVIDTGIGIKQEDIPTIFKLFGKLKHNDPEINKNGVGLGLVISQNLSKLLYDGIDKGIHVESDVGKGTVFWFYIHTCDYQSNLENFGGQVSETKNQIYESKAIHKKNRSKPNSHDSESENLLEGKETSRKSRILVVDDDQMNLLVAKEYLKFFELDFFLANNGKEALDIVENDYISNKENIDLILMDCNMPIMDGMTASIKIKKILKDTNSIDIPIVALTANVSSVDIESCYNSGMDYYLSKPVRRSELGELLSKILKIKLL